MTVFLAHGASVAVRGCIYLSRASSRTKLVCAALAVPCVVATCAIAVVLLPIVTLPLRVRDKISDRIQSSREDDRDEYSRSQLCVDWHDE